MPLSSCKNNSYVSSYNLQYNSYSSDMVSIRKSIKKAKNSCVMLLSRLVYKTNPHLFMINIYFHDYVFYMLPHFSRSNEVHMKGG